MVISFVILVRATYNSFEARDARAARLSFLTRSIKFLICGVVVVADAKSLACAENIPLTLGSLSKHDVDGSENVI